MRRFIRGIVGAVGVELRRPASLIACAAGCCVGLAASMGGSSPAWRVAASFLGGLLAVASLGELPAGILDPLRRRPGELATWAVARSLFPMVGVVASAMVPAALDAAGLSAPRPACNATNCPRGPLMDGSLAAILLPMVVSSLAQWSLTVSGGRGSEPAAATLMIAAAASSGSAAGLASGWVAIGQLLLTAVAAGCTFLLHRRERTGCPRGRGKTVWLWPLPTQGRLRPAITAIAMAVSLIAMVAWLVPQPPLAGRYWLLATAVWIALSVPTMTLADGVLDRLGWSMVLRPPHRAGRGGWPPVGRIAFGHAAIFAWPLVVAGAVAARLPVAALAVGAAAVGLFLLAALASAIGLPFRRREGSPEAAQAADLGVIAAALAWLLPGIPLVFSIPGV